MPVETDAPVRKLHREYIVAAALELLDDVGFSKLTVRSLAARLHVQAAALYWHFKNKQELIDAMAAAITPSPSLENASGWRDLLGDTARTARMTLMRHRDGAQVIAHANVAAQEQALADREALFAYLVNQGFSLELAAASLYAVMRFTLGCVFEEQADPRMQRTAGADDQTRAAWAEKYPTLAAAYHIDGDHDVVRLLDEQFERSLDIMLDGIQVRLDALPKVA